MKRFLAVLLASALILATAIGFAACGSSNEGTQGVTDDTILVGNAAATSGAFAMVGVPFNEGMLAYFHQVNEAGGIHGRQIEFVHHDDGFDPVTGLAFTEALIHDDRVFAIVGHFGTPTIGATLDLIKDTGIPAVYFAAGIGALFSEDAFDNARGRNLFPVQPIFLTEGRILAARAADQSNAQTIGAIFSSDEAGHDMMDGIRYMANNLGLTLVEHQVSPGQADVSSAVLSMEAAGVDAVIVATLQPTFIIVANAISVSNLNVPIFTSYVSADAIALASIADDYIGAGATFPIYSTAWLDAFAAEAFMEFVEGVTAFGNPELALSAFAMAGWIAGSTFVQGLRATPADDITWESFIDAMENSPVNLPMAGMMDFSNGQRTGTQDLALVQANMETLTWDTIHPLESLGTILQRIGR